MAAKVAGIRNLIEVAAISGYRNTSEEDGKTLRHY
jgi:hypothetical protein